MKSSSSSNNGIAFGKESVLLLEHVFSEIDTRFVVQVRKGDLTMEKVDAIVNAANCRLQHMSGLAGAIVKNGGQIIQKESNKLINGLGRDLENGEVVETISGDLPCKTLFHAVGPIWSSRKPNDFKTLGTEQEDFELGMCVEASLSKAVESGFSSISLPAISSGIFGFPKDRCAKVLFNVVTEFLNGNKDKIKGDRFEVRFTNFDDETCNIFSKEFKSRFQ